MYYSFEEYYLIEINYLIGSITRNSIMHYHTRKTGANIGDTKYLNAKNSMVNTLNYFNTITRILYMSHYNNNIET